MWPFHNKKLQQDYNRLEAFLSAIPGDYCGFSNHDLLAYSQAFPSVFGLESVSGVPDIIHVIKQSDGIELERLFERLKTHKENFTLTVQHNTAPKYIDIQGTYGRAGEQEYYILWVKDVSDIQQKIDHHAAALKQLEQSSQQAADMWDSVLFPCWRRDQSLHMTWCNEAYAQLLGAAQDQILQEQKEISLSQKGQSPYKSIKELAQNAIDSNALQETECHIIAGGKRKFVKIIEMPIHDNQATLGVMIDIDKQDDLHTQITRQTTANRTLLEQLRSAIALFDADQRLEFYNNSFSHIWSLEEQWLNTKPKLGEILEKLRELRKLPEQADFRHYKQGWLDMFTRLIGTHEDMMYLPDGSAIRLLVTPHPMGGLMMIFEDVTSRLELESSYNTLIAVQKETLDNLSEGVAVFGTDGRLKLSNPAFASLWGLNPEDVDGQPHHSKMIKNMTKLFDGDSQNKAHEILTSHAIERAAQEGRLSFADNRLIEYSTVPLPDGGVLASYFDITDSVKVENALREKNQALEEAEKLKTDFLANVSYQLRTPLNVVMGFTEILNEQYFGKLNEKQLEYTRGIYEAGDKLVNLINDILDLSSIEAGYLTLDKTTFNVHDMLQDLQELVIPWARQEKVNLIVCSDFPDVELCADKQRLQQVLINLMNNALAHTSEGGQIIISSEMREGKICIHVSDTGVGIPQDELNKIFKPFEKLQKSHSQQSSIAKRGAGLGLSLVKNIIDLHGGKVLIESEEGKGTTVTLCLPISDDTRCS